jgi:hypothetical protein
MVPTPVPVAMSPKSSVSAELYSEVHCTTYIIEATECAVLLAAQCSHNNVLPARGPVSPPQLDNMIGRSACVPRSRTRRDFSVLYVLMAGLTKESSAGSSYVCSYWFGGGLWVESPAVLD